MQDTSTNMTFATLDGLMSIGRGAAVGAAAGVTFGPVGVATGAIAGAAHKVIIMSADKLSGDAEKEEPTLTLGFKKIAASAAAFFASVGVTMGIAGVTFTAACIFVGVMTGYGMAVLILLAIIGMLAKAYLNQPNPKLP